MRRRRVISVIAMLLPMAGGWFLAYRWANQHRTVARAHAEIVGLATQGGAAAQQAAGLVRPARALAAVNPYAVVHGGICVPGNAPDQEDASRKKWEALLVDPFWKSIFSGVDPEKFRLVTTSLPLERYVAYWKMENGQLIHWTGKKIAIPAGTRVFTDGQGAMYLCACGNHVAAVLPPKMTTTVLPTEEEPPVAFLVPPEPEDLFAAPARESPVATPRAPATTPTSKSGPPPIPPAFLVQPGPRVPKRPPHTPPPVPPQTPPQLPVVPEPGTLSLVLLGLAAGLAARHRRN